MTTRYPTSKRPGDSTFSAQWSGVTGAPKIRGRVCAKCGGPVHREAGEAYCPYCDNYVSTVAKSTRSNPSAPFGWALVSGGEVVKVSRARTKPKGRGWGAINTSGTRVGSMAYIDRGNVYLIGSRTNGKTWKAKTTGKVHKAASTLAVHRWHPGSVRGNPVIREMSGDEARRRIWARLRTLHAELLQVYPDAAHDLQKRFLSHEAVYAFSPQQLRRAELEARRDLNWARAAHTFSRK